MGSKHECNLLYEGMKLSHNKNKKFEVDRTWRPALEVALWPLQTDTHKYTCAYTLMHKGTCCSWLDIKNLGKGTITVRQIRKLLMKKKYADYFFLRWDFGWPILVTTTGLGNRNLLKVVVRCDDGSGLWCSEPRSLRRAWGLGSLLNTLSHMEGLLWTPQKSCNVAHGNGDRVVLKFFSHFSFSCRE